MSNVVNFQERIFQRRRVSQMSQTKEAIRRVLLTLDLAIQNIIIIAESIKDPAMRTSFKNEAERLQRLLEAVRQQTLCL